MLSPKRLIPLCVVGLLLLLTLPTGIHAQTSTQILINYPEVVEGDEAVSLGLYFTILDSNGRGVPDAKVQSAKIILDDGSRYDAQVEQPTTPFYIVLVLDASGSMAGSAEAMRQAAIQAIKDAPDQAQFAVIRFNQKIDVLQDFTDDANRAINAIGEVVPVNQSGTCLYDATYQGIDLLSNLPPGRRAIILFTDGVDETLEGNPCSTHTFGEVMDYAKRPQSRVPINTIGLSSSTQRINTSELSDMASATGGLSAFGSQENLPDLFKQIMDALKSQWLAQATIYPTAGQHTATLIVTLEDGSSPQPAVVTFTISRDYAFPTTPTPTATPVQVSLQIDSATFDLNQDMVLLEVSVHGEELISEYRFEFVDADTNLLQNRFILPAPLQHPVSIPAGELKGKLRIVLRAVDSSGNFITWLDANNKPIDYAEYELSILRPTPTPLPATSTQEPVAVTLNSISYDQSTDTLTLDLSLTGQDKIGSLEIDVLNADTNLRVSVFNQPPAETIQLSTDGLTAGGKYTIHVIAQSPTGQNLSRSNEQPFTYTPFLTPTPTNTATPTRTPTQPPIEISIASIDIDQTAQQIVIGVITNNQDRIASYELQIRNSETGLLVGNFAQTPPPFDTIRIPLSDIPGGKYTAILRAFGADRSLLKEASPLNFVYTPPPTPTPQPTQAPTPIPPPPPKPSLPDRIRDNPLLALIVGLVAVGLIALLVVLLRPHKRSQTGTGFLAAQTGFYQMPAAPGSPEAAKEELEATSVVSADSEATDVFSEEMLPVATLTINKSPDPSRSGQGVVITRVPFKLGRSGGEANDFNFDEDKSISRSHARITFENGTFYIIDEKSGNGTSVDGNRIPPQTPVPLYSGARILLGTATVLVFETKSSAAPEYDPDKTDYYRPSDTR